MTPREFLNSIVQPNVDEFESNYGDLRHAYNAISAVDALASYIYVWAKVNAPLAVASVNDDTHYRHALAKRNPSFRLLRDTAKAQKHAHLTRGNPEIARADQIAARAIGWGEARFGEGRFGGVEQVVIDTAPNEFAYVETVIESSLTFLKDEMSALGI